MSSIAEKNTSDTSTAADITDAPQSEDAASEITSSGNNATVETSESILIVGATGLTGQKIVKNLARIVKPNQTLYILSRCKFTPVNRPNVVNKVMESAMWPSEIAKIPNLVTVYSALGARGPSRFVNNQLNDTPSDEAFIEVNYNLNLQVAIAAKLAGAQNFILVSNYMVSHLLPNIFHRKTKVRALVEQELTDLKFHNLIIFRPGPLVGLRGKVGSLTNFSVWSLVEGLGLIAATPFFFFNINTPGSIFSFATTVGKASSIVVENLEKTTNIQEPNVKVYGAYQIIGLGTIYNTELFWKTCNALDTLSKAGTFEYEEFEELSVLLLGESLSKQSSINSTIDSA